MLSRYFDDKPVILVPAYYECPMLCTQIINGLLSGLRPLSLNAGSDFVVVTFSIDPDEGSDLAAAKKITYVDGYGREGGEAGWHFLTGNPSAIKALTQTIGYRYAYDSETDGRARFAPHTAIVDPLTNDDAAPRQSIESRLFVFF